MPASSEFIALCQSQIDLLTRGLGASLSVVYLTEEFSEAANPKLVPLVAYPEAIVHWNDSRVLALLYTGMYKANSDLRLPSPDWVVEHSSPNTLALPASTDSPAQKEASVPPAVEAALLQQQQIVLPLMHEGVVMGILVTSRSDRMWNDREQTQIERIARTLAIACVLDQRGQWLAQDSQQRRQLQAEQYDLLDDLLHQFRNPLTAIRTFGKLLMRRIIPEDPNRSSVEGIVRESDRLQDLLREFDSAIDLGRADLLPYEAEPTSDVIHSTSPPSSPEEAKSTPLLPSARLLGSAQLQLEPHAIAEVLRPLLESAEAIAQERHLEIHKQIPTELPPVCIDIKALREVLSNLIDNALKYTPAGGQVYVGVVPLASADASQQAIVIADTGPGIPPQDLEHLFERHYRGVQAKTDIPGTGLGLAIARELVNQMHGEIQVFSPSRSSELVRSFYLNPELQIQPGTAVVVWLPQAT